MEQPVNAIEDINSSVDGPDTKRADALNEENEKNESMQFILSDTVLINIAGLNRLEIKEAKDAVGETVTRILQQGVTLESLNQVNDQVRIMSDLLNISDYVKSIVNFISPQLIKVNSVLDEEATRLVQEKARNSVTPITKKVIKGQIILAKGELIIPEIEEVIQELNITTPINNPYVWFAIIFLPFVILFGLYFIVFWADKWVLLTHKRLLLYSSLIGVFFVASSILVPYNIFLIPIPLVAFLLTMFLGSKTSIPTIMFIGWIPVMFYRTSTLNTAGTVAIIVGFALLGLMTCLHLDRVKRFSDFFLVAVYSLTGAFIVVTLMLTFMNADSNAALINYSYGFASTGIQVVVGFGLTPLLEHLTKKSTVFRLLELSDLNSPLLKKLSVEAPGTYQHSLLVGNMASVACERIGANSLLARVGGYYHDIGKLKYPDFFIENQTGQNPHEEISPTMSTLIITKHIKEGMELARKYSLPPMVESYIQTHHGTTVVKYFYHKAKEKDPLCRESEFRYKGIKPQTVEEAIVMIADAAESAARSRKPERGKIEDLVDSIIQDRINDGQLSECPVSLGELTIISKALADQIASTSHERVPYPDEKNETKK